MNSILYSIIVPVYKSTKSLEELTQKVENVFASLLDSEYELIFVNDSPFCKKTVEVLLNISKENSKVVVIEFTKNYGQQAATLSGIEIAKGDFIITMDDDLQHNPEDIILLIEEKQHDIVIAKFRDNKHSFFKQRTSSIKGYFDYLLLGKPRHIKLSSFRLIKSEIAKMMFARQTPYPFIPALLFSITEDVINVEVKHNSRYEGKSNYTVVKMIKLFSNLLINNSSFLLRIIGYIGIVVALLSFMFGGYVIVKKIFFGFAVEGWTSMMVSVLFFGGMILFTLGIMGEYLVRIIATAEKRPVYFIRHIIRKKIK